MSNLRELKKHLNSVEMTGQMAGAMKTASAVKFSKISAALDRFSGYAGACRRQIHQYRSKKHDNRKQYLVNLKQKRRIVKG